MTVLARHADDVETPSRVVTERKVVATDDDGVTTKVVATIERVQMTQGGPKLVETGGGVINE